MGRGNQFVLGVVAILNASPRSLEAAIQGGRGTGYWESAPGTRCWLRKTRRAFLCPGNLLPGHLAGRQCEENRVLVLSGFTHRGYKEMSEDGKSRIRPGQRIMVQHLAPFQSLCVALNSASPRNLVKGALKLEGQALGGPRTMQRPKSPKICAFLPWACCPLAKHRCTSSLQGRFLTRLG